MDHPFHVDGKGWTAVEDMGPGDQLISADGAPMLVKSIEAEGYTATTYNLTVANAHTFFVGEKRIWVHNQNGGCGDGGDGGESPDLDLGPLPEVNRVVNSNAPHAIDRAMKERRLGFETRAEANAALKDIRSNIRKNGWPSGTIMHINGKDVLVPFGDGYAVYRVQNGRAVLKTAITAAQARTYAPD